MRNSHKAQVLGEEKRHLSERGIRLAMSHLDDAEKNTIVEEKMFSELPSTFARILEHSASYPLQ